MIPGWSRKGGANLSQRVLDRIKPGAPIKNKIRAAQSELNSRITRLDSVHEKLRQRNDAIFRKIVEAQKSNNQAGARAYAIELQELRKITGMVYNAKTTMEQVQYRLNTISDFGDVVVALSPCMSVIKDIHGSIGTMMPEAGSAMQDLSEMLGDILDNSAIGEPGIPAGMPDMPGGTAVDAGTAAILKEAQTKLEGRMKTSLPDLPASLEPVMAVPDLPASLEEKTSLPDVPASLKEDIVQRRGVYT